MEQPNDTARKLDIAIKANISALADVLARAAKVAGDARDHADADERLTAIGAIIDLNRQLTDAVALYGAAIALHHRARR